MQVYGNFQAKATMDGMLLANPDKRPFVLSRAGFIGNQRFSATWSGDNLSNWEHLAMSVPMALNMVSWNSHPIHIASNLWLTFTKLYVTSYYRSQTFLTFSFACVQGLSGQPLSGPDIGGFAGDATPKMFVRWMGIGAMMPFSRGHSEKGTIDQEPWAFGPEVSLESILVL